MAVWPFGIGDARFVTVVMARPRVVERGSPVSFQKSADGRVFAHDAAGLPLGEVLEESSVLRLRHTLETDTLCIAEVANVAPRTARLEALVSWPVTAVALPDTIRIVLSAKVQKQVQYRFHRELGDQDLNDWLRETFLYQGRYLVRAPITDKPGAFLLLSPAGQLYCEMRDSTFVWVVSPSRLPKNSEAVFQRAGVIAGQVEWLSSESEVPQAAQGALTLLEAIAARSEYFDIWAKYRDLELEMLRGKTAELGPLNYRRLRTLEQVLRFELEPGSDTARWQDSASGLSAELVVPRNKGRRGKDEPEADRTMPLGTIRRVTADYIDVDRPDDEFGLPPKGRLRVSMLGDEVRLARQHAAQERLRSGATPVPNLETLLSTGGVDERFVHQVAGFREFPMALADGTPPNPRQIEAVEMALNTPDICVIQGPPGTGKTAVIRTILKRLKEEGRRHLLISSYQHNAVDNALDGLQACGVMSYRFGGSEAGDSYRSSEIDAWVAEVVEAATSSLLHAPSDDPPYLRQMQLRDIARAAVETRADVSQCLELLTRMTAEFGTALTPHMGAEAGLLRLELETHLAQPESAAHAGAEVGKLARLLQKIPSQADDLRTASVVGQIRLEMERLCGQGWGSPETLGQYKAHATKIRQLGAQARYGLDQSDASRRLVAEVDAARAVVAQFVEQCTLRGKMPSTAGTSETGVGLLLAFDRWCSTVAEGMERQMAASRGHVHAIIEEWRHDITNHRARVKELLRKHADVWGVTCQQVAARRFALYDEEFDYVVIDEAARASPLDLLIPLVRARHIVLVGDQMQLPHALDYELEKAFEAAAEQPEQKRVLKDSLFARLYDQLPPTRRIRLNYQYRMNPVISRMVSDVFYRDDPLRDAPSTAELVNDTGLFEGRPLAWVDVAPVGSTRKLEHGQYYNRSEVDLLVSYVRDLIDANTPHSIGVITFYAQQRDQIERSLRDRVPGARGVQVGTVDAFQGMQRDIILLSMVRSNPEKRVGFLNSPNRLNVSLSRARRLLVLIGDVGTVTSNPHLRSVYEYCLGVDGVIHQV